MRTTTRLRKLLEGPRILLAPGAYDALSAKLIQQAGFEAVYMTGAGVTISLLGEPDVGLATMTEMVDQAAPKKCGHFPGSLYRSAIPAMQRVLEEIKRTGTTQGMLDQLLSFEDRNRITGLARVFELERRFLAGP